MGSDILIVGSGNYNVFDGLFDFYTVMCLCNPIKNYLKKKHRIIVKINYNNEW